MSDKKGKASSSQNNNPLYNNMRTKNGTISSTYIKNLKAEYKTLLKNKTDKVKGAKTKFNAFLKTEFKKAQQSGIGLVFLDDGRISVRDIFISSDRQKYIKDAKKEKAKYHNVDIGDVINRDKRLRSIDSKLAKKKKTIKPTSVKRELISKGIITKYLFRYEDYTEDFLENVMINIDRAMSSVIPRHKDQKFIVRLSNTTNALTDKASYGVKTFGTPSIDEIKNALQTKMEQALNNYEEDGDELNFKSIGISVIAEPYGQILGAGGHRSQQTAAKSWFISNQTSKTNCFYRSIATHNILSQYSKNEDLDTAREELVVKPQLFLDRVTNSAVNIKKRLKTGNIRATSESDIQKYVDNCYKKNSSNKCEVKIYNNVFSLIKIIRPTNWTGDKLKHTYEIQNINHHFIALVRWYNVKNILDVLDEVIQIATAKAKEKALLEDDMEDINELIDREPDMEINDWDKFKEFCEKEIWNKDEGRCIPVDYENANKTDQKKYERWFKYRYGLQNDYCKRHMNGLNIRMGAYDLEATPNGVDDNIFIPYRLSFSYNEIDDNGNFKRIKTITFGGKDCIPKWFEWLYKNRDELSGYTLYAHNGGKFDVLLLLNDYILKNTSKWILEEGTLIVLNGAYLSFSLSSKEGDIEGTASVSHGIPDHQLKTAIKNKKAKDSDKIEALITFRDSMRLLPGSLKKLCDEFDVEHKKLSEVVDFDEVNVGNCFGGEINSKRPFSHEKFKIELCNYVYCNYDVIGLLEILNKFSKSVYEACNGINITDCITGASLSKKHYFNTFYDKKNFPVWNLNSEYDQFCRDGYFGGRCEAFFIGEQKKKLYYYDFTSLYPDVGRRRLPYGEPKKLESERIERWNERYRNKQSLFPLRAVVKVRVKTKDFKALPLHACKDDGKLTFAHFGDWTEMTMWYRELEYGVSLNIYDYELVDGIEFDGGHHTYVKTSYMNSPANKLGKKDREHFWDDGILKEFFEDAVSKKALAKKSGQPALAQAYKIIANSGYGFWGLNANGDGEGRDGMSIVNEEDDYFWELMASGCVSNIGKIGDYILVRTSKKMSVRDFNVAIATAICSEARMKTYRFLKAVRDNNHNILYCDTDSCICDLKLNDYPDMMKEFCWDGLKDPETAGDELGSMKNECLEKVEGYYKSKVLKELGEDCPKSIWKPKMKEWVDKEKAKDGGELSFDKGIIAGCKQYSLHKRLIDGGEVVAGACKGCKRKLKYHEFSHLLFGTMIEEQREAEKEILKRNPSFKIPEGFRLYEQQTQFRSSTSDHIAEGNFTEVKRIEIDKSIRVNYTKGIVEDKGWVIPHILNIKKDEDEGAIMGNAY